MNKDPLVSVIISTYNSEKFIKGRIENLLEQTIADKFEIIIINSGSEQDEEKIINRFLADNSNIIYLRTENRETIYQAWNRGIKIAKGEFITNANTDDRLKKDALEILSNKLIEHPDIALVYSNQYIIDTPDLNIDTSKVKKCYFPDFNRIYLMERCIIGSQPMWRASIHFQDNIWFDESFEICGDFEFELNISQRYKILHIPEFLGYFYKSPNKTNKEFQNPKRTMEEVEKITTTYVDKFIMSASNETLIKILNEYLKKTRIPIPFLIILRRLFKIFDKNIYPRKYFHTIEFIYYLVSKIYIWLNDPKKAVKYCKKYLRYKNSKKINNLYESLEL